ncbi:MAG: hypothetical protein [Podoviridae sp. ctLUJ1]|nr:MAG: hypothetical protein [Podoviridae sp. ctLUJ1]
MNKQTLNLTSAELSAVQLDKKAVDEATIPAVEGAKNYFALVVYQGVTLLCILDNGKWRPTTQMELMRLM